MENNGTLVAFLAGGGRWDEIRLVTDRDALNKLDVPDDVPAVVTFGEAGEAPQEVYPISLIELIMQKYEELRSRA